jgi:RNA-directed DNA polymerase
LSEAFLFHGKGQKRGLAARVHLIRYADDFIVTSRSKNCWNREVKAIIESFLPERGLNLSPEKNKITHITEGFDFLSQHIRRYPNGNLLRKPARESIRSLLVLGKEIIREHYGSMAQLLIVHLSSVIRGWATIIVTLSPNASLPASPRQ